MSIIHRATTRHPYSSGAGRTYFWLAVAIFLGLGTVWAADGEPLDPNSGAAQADLIVRMTVESEASKAEAIQWAQTYGFPIRYDDGQRVCELMAVWKDRPVYYATDNVNAAISTTADRIRDMVPWQLDGSGVVVGLWDESVARATHQEFLASDGQRRVQAGDAGGSSPHTTHVAGTIGATGIDPAARGMAPATRIQSFNWNYDASKMAMWTAYGPGQSNSIYVSNHSYGLIGGWVKFSTSEATGHAGWHWTGLWGGAKSYDDWFGTYHPTARQWDDVAYTKNYYLAFAAAGNERTDNPPLGETVYYWKSGLWYSIVYSPDTCPPGDGAAKGGYDTICGPGVAKNIMTIGAVGDAVADGARSLADANMATFSSWGPTDDGRIKPDIVTNGIRLYSADSNSDESYATHSGTSMASPGATGSAALLVQLYHQLFPGKSMRASTLKGLIIHTADDLGRPGPDYQFGWGLMNARAAAELIQRQSDESAGSVIVEGRLTSNNPMDVNPDDAYYFYADANEPIRITLCWTDPPAAAVIDYDNRSPRLIHDLDLRVTGPEGSTTYCPYVLDPADPCAIARTGDNKVDNVEQVYIGAPSEVGLYKVFVNYKGQLAKGEQHYSIISSAPLFAQRPPTSEDMSVYTSVSTALTITLKATDDALPKPPASLTYTIVSLPQHGSLAYQTGTPITQPGKLANYASQVVYTPAGGYIGGDSVLFYADDGGTAPAGGASNTAVVTISVKDLVTREYQVAESADDGSALSWNRFQGTLDRVLRVGQYVTGMRFQGIDIPPGAQITGAYLKVRSETPGAVDGSIQAEATGNAANLTGQGRNVLDMTRTQAAVSWNWTGKEPASIWYNSPDCSAIVQEIVGRPEWKAGNAILLIYSGTRTGSKDKDIAFYSRDHSAAYAPRLEITYTTKSGTSAGPGQNRPTASDVETYVCANTPVPILLDATDDGLPEPLRFAISSLPGHGSLAFVNGIPIKEPVSFADSTSRVIYTPDPGFSGGDSFTFRADDGGSAPTGGKSNVAAVTLKVRHMVTREYQVITQEDDAYGADDKTIVFSETLSVGQPSSAMRFRNIDIPQTSEIISARLKISMDTTSIQKSIEGTLYAQAVGDTYDFNYPELQIPELPRTQASIPWVWDVGQMWPRETYCPSPDLRAVIQEIIDRQDWFAGNSMVILYAGDTYNGQNLQFFACDTPFSRRAVKLQITCAPAEREPAGSHSGKEHPPSAKSVSLTVALNGSATISLDAVDDDLPTPPGKLTYTVASLPKHGVLELPDGSRITTVPLTLVDNRSEVVYKPQPDFTGGDSFTFYADDGGTAPTGGRSNTATMTISVRNATICSFQVTASADDASVLKSDAENRVSDTILRVGGYSSGMRFRNINIPRAGTIIGARLQVCTDALDLGNPIEGLIQAEAAGNAADFAGPQRHIWNLTRTKGSRIWKWTAGEYKGWYSSPDFSEVVQEILNRPDWSEGNSIAITYLGNAGVARDVEFFSYDKGPAYAPKLEIIYVSGVQPASYWQFEEGGGDIVRDSTGNRDGTVHGAQWTIGRVGGGLAFDGIDDYVALPYNDPVWLPRGDFTIAFWVYFNTGDATHYVSANEIVVDLNCAKSSDPANELGSNIQRRLGTRQICFQMTTLDNPDEDLYTKTIFDKDRWYHVAAVRQGALQQIYVNGELDNSRDCSSSPIDYTGNWDDDRVNLGAYSTISRTSGFFNGKLDEVALFYKGLSATEIRQVYAR
jgi:hypothetical protein